MEGGQRELYSIANLEACSYRFLQHTAKSLSLPSNVKKVYLIKLIYTQKHCSQKEVDDLVKQVRQERQQQAQARRKAVKRKKYVQQSMEISSTTSNSQSPPISNTPKRMNHYFIRYSPETHTPYRVPRVMPTKTNALNSSDRVLRSFKRIKKPSYLLNNTLLSLINSSGSEDMSETRVNIVSKQKYQKINKTYVRRTNKSDFRNRGELVPMARSANIMSSSAPVKPQRRLSGIYPLTSENIRIPSVSVRRPDGTLCKINAIIQRPLAQHNYNDDRPARSSQSLLKLVAADDQPQTAAKSSQTTPNFACRAPNITVTDRAQNFRYRTPNVPESRITSTFGNRALNLPEDASTFGYRGLNLPDETSASGCTALKLPDVTSASGYRGLNLPDVASASGYRGLNLPDVASASGYRGLNLPDIASASGYRGLNLPDVTSASGYRGLNLPDVTSASGYRALNPEVTSTFGYGSQNLREVTSAFVYGAHVPKVASSFGHRASNLPELTSTYGYRTPNLPELPSTFGYRTNFEYRAPNLPEVASTFYRSQNLPEVTPFFENRAPNLPELGLDVGYRAPNNSLVDFPQNSFNYYSSSSEDMNISNMYKENQSEEYSVYYHKKIRAEQVRSLRCRETARCVENECRLPRINEVFSKFNNVYSRDVTQPIYVQVDSEPEIAANTSFIPDPHMQYQGGIELEKLYNLKNTNQSLLQISTTNNTHTVYCTPVISTVKAQPTSIAAENDYNTATVSRDSQPCFMDEEMPRVHDFFKNFRCDEDNIHDTTTVGFSGSSSSMETLTSQEQEQELGANVTIPEMVEDALEIISQDGDYMERMGMDIRMQCIFCNWAGPNMILEYHIRKEHSEDIIQCDSGSWSATYTLGGLAARRRWVTRVLDHRAALYVLRAQYHDPDCFVAALSTISADPDSPKTASMTIYNKVTGEPLTWQGDVTPLPPHMPDSDPHYFRLPLSKMDLLPNSANLKLLNRELVVDSPNKVVVGQPELDNIYISLMIKIFD